MEGEEHKGTMSSTPAIPAKNTKISLSVKFVGRYVPPPKPKAARARKSTLKHTRTDGHILEDDEELMDEILDDDDLMPPVRLRIRV